MDSLFFSVRFKGKPSSLGVKEVRGMVRVSISVFLIWFMIFGLGFAETRPSPRSSKTAPTPSTPPTLAAPAPPIEDHSVPYAVAGIATIIAIAAIGFQQSLVNKSNRLLKEADHRAQVAQEEGRKADLRAKEADEARTAVLEKYSSIMDLDSGQQKLLSDKAALESDIRAARERWVEEDTKAKAELDELMGQVILLRGLAEMQSCGLYEPIFDFDSSERYKAEVTACYERQENLIKLERAVVCAKEWSVEGSVAKGREMTKRYSKLMLRAFNGEADVCVAKARFDNVVQLRDRIRKSCDAINLLGKSYQITITSEYRDAKVEELHLAYELARKKDLEKEEQRAIRAQMKEEEEARKEIERAQKEAEAEEIRYSRALETARKELENARNENHEALKKKISLLELQFEEAHQRKAKAIARAQLTKSGHVYIISNMGSFGEEVFKIGMTRRLEPLDRINELGGASVPFRFDVHAMVYSDNAPALEHSIHQKFGNRQINRVNPRREFFRVTLDEIESAVRELCDKETEFVRTAVAEEFRESEAIRQKEEQERLAAHQVRVKDEVAQARDRLAQLKESWKAEPVA